MWFCNKRMSALITEVVKIFPVAINSVVFVVQMASRNH